MALRGRDIVCISSIDWDFIWQGHQEIMAALAAQGNRVLFIENTGVRAPTLRDLPRLRHRVRNWLRGTKGFRQEREQLFVYAPVILPFPYARIAQWINRGLLRGALRRWMRAMRFRPSIVWTFLPTPLACDLIRELSPDVTVYYCIDDLASSSPAARRVSRSEAELFRRAELTFVTSERLRQHAARYTDRVHLFPFGVQFERFEQARTAPEGMPQALAQLPRPVIGYLGGLHQWIDFELVARVAAQLPHVSFALVGPQQADVGPVAACANVHLLGPQAHQDVPKFVKGFDVGIVPYRLSRYTEHVYPTKLNEYLAMGLPVVSTDLPEIRRFNADHGPVVSIAGDANQFARAITEALGGRSAGAAQERIDVARGNSWRARIDRMAALIERALDERSRARLPWQDTLRKLYRAARRRFLTAAVGAVAAYLLVFQSPLVWWLAEPLRWRGPLRPADAIVVLGGGAGESGKPGGGYQERVKQAVDLYRVGLAPRIVFSSGFVYAFPEAQVMRELAIAHGVPPEAIALETGGTNTHESTVEVSRLLERLGAGSALLVSSPYHMRRASLAMRRAAPGMLIIPSPVASSQFYAHGRGASLEQLRGILHEYAGLIYYWWKRWI